MKKADQQQLIKRRNQLIETIGQLKGAIRGTLVKTQKKCGRKTCSCEQGQLHPHMYVSIHKKPQNKVVYIRPREVEDTQKGIQACRQVLNILDEISLINIELIKSRFTKNDLSGEAENNPQKEIRKAPLALSSRHKERRINH